jgi:hypothetical protein
MSRRELGLLVPGGSKEVGRRTLSGLASASLHAARCLTSCWVCGDALLPLRIVCLQHGEFDPGDVDGETWSPKWSDTDDAYLALLECSAALNPRPWLLAAAFAAVSGGPA